MECVCQYSLMRDVYLVLGGSVGVAVLMLIVSFVLAKEHERAGLTVSGRRGIF